jgi:hypothetical protein
MAKSDVSSASFSGPDDRGSCSLSRLAMSLAIKAAISAGTDADCASALPPEVDVWQPQRQAQ